MPADIVPAGTPDEWLALVRFDAQGLVPVICQDALSGEVLMFAWADREALAHTLRTGRGAYHSRSRGGLWVKGDTSGHVQTVREIRLDCDGDCVLYRVEQDGAACHQHRRSCFSHRVDPDGSVVTDRPVIG